MFSDKDKQFLLKLKQDGKSPEEALDILNKVKKMGPVSPDTPQVSEGERMGKREAMDLTEEQRQDLISQPSPVTRGIEREEDPGILGGVAEIGKDVVREATGAFVGPVQGVVSPALEEAERLGADIPEGVQETFRPKGITQRVFSAPTKYATEMALGTGKGVASTGLGIAELLGVEEAGALREKLEPEGITQNVGFITEQLGEFMIPSAKIGKLAKMTEAANLLNKYPKLAKMVPFLAASAGEAAVGAGVTAAQEGELGTEAAVMGAVSGVSPAAAKGIEQLGKLGSKIYQAAFKATKGDEKKLYQAFKTTVGKTAEELGYTGTAEEIAEMANQGAKAAKDQINSIAKADKKIYTAADFESIAEKITQRMTKGLPDSAVKKQITEEVKDTVMSYAPTKSASAEEMVGILDNINSEQFVGKTTLTEKQLQSIESKVKTEIKDMLPDDVKPLYREAAMNKTIQKVMENNIVKRLVARTGYGAGTGALVGGISADNPEDLVKRIIVMGIGGALLGRATGSTKGLTKTGKALKGLQGKQDITEPAIKSTIYALRTFLNEPNE